MVDGRVMDNWFQKFLLIFSVQILVIAAQSNQDSTILQVLKNQWENTPPNWVGSDPCGGKWEGIGCSNSRVTSITLSSLGLNGPLPGDIVNLSELQMLDLSYNKGLTGTLPPSIGNLKKLTNLILVGCSFDGTIPDSIGSLEQLVYLSLNSNGFTGRIPPSIGNLLNLYWLDLADNKLTGNIPVSSGGTPGLDLLVNTKHFHFGKNQLSGTIPSSLFNSNLSLIHVLFDSNKLTGSIPSTIGLVKTLEAVRLDRNSLRGTVPSTLSDLDGINELFLSNNELTGPMPDLTGMSSLNYLDMSNNTFNASDVPTWFSTLKSLTTLVMQGTGLRGPVPTALFSSSPLQTVILSQNKLNGTLDFGSSYSNQLQLVDLQNNLIDAFKQGDGYKNDLVLVGNPICLETGVTQTFCSIPVKSNLSYATPSNCAPVQCGLNKISSPNCKCAYPYTGTLFFRAPSFSDIQNPTIYASLQTSMMLAFRSDNISVDSISLSNPTKNLDDYLVINLEIFPSSGVEYFNRSEILAIGFELSNQTFKPPDTFGPYFFIGQDYRYFSGASTGSQKKSSNSGIIAGAAAGGSALLLLLILAGLYAYRQKRRAERADQQNNPFALWDPNKTSGGIPQLKGARNFSFEELKKCTNSFSETNNIGSGGYGMVYRGTLSNGLLVAIKRAQQGSTQGAFEFKTEIELLSRVHHTNVVSLVGFCFDQSEQMLVYEYIPNGTLKDSLTGDSGVRMDWMRRLRIALGAARGLQYLHDLANPPIIHRDIKSNNILLDERLNAKVADFGLSKPMGESDRGHVTTQVKGTMGYLDPEYYMTQQLTEKSDVYSFGVVLLELVTAKNPIEKGLYIVRYVKQAMDKTKELYNLQGIIDPAIGSVNELKGLERFVDLALSCVKEAGHDRPSMSNVVKEIENIMQLAGFNPNAESAPTSENYAGASMGSEHPYTNDSLFNYSGTHLPTYLEPK